MYICSKQGRVHSNSKLHGNLPVRLVADQLKVLVAEAVNVRPLRVYAERLRARRLSAALLAPGQPQGPADKPVTQQALGHGRGASARGLPGTQPSSPSGHTRRRGRRCRRRWTPHGPHVPSRRPSGCCSKKWRRGARREGPRLVAQLLLQRRHVAAVHVRVAHADDQLARAQAAHLPPAARTLSRAGAAARPAGRPAGALPYPYPAAWGAGRHGGAAEAVQCGHVGMGWGTDRCLSPARAP